MTNNIPLEYCRNCHYNWYCL